MQAEDAVPQSRRYLWLHGYLSKVGLDFARAGFPRVWPTTVRALFVGYAYADLPLGKTFALAFPYGKPDLAVPTYAVIHAVTQQFAKPFPEVPHGWKTICLIDFPDGVPAVVASLPTEEGWALDLRTVSA